MRHNLLEAFDHIGSLLDSGSQVDTIYLDMSKAFVEVSHRRLVHKLIQAGFGCNLLNWFCSYLSGRRQRVTVFGATSEDLPVTSGVPQGSILGPALFLLYVNEFPEVISSSSRVLMFADERLLLRTFLSFLIRTSGIWNCLVNELDLSSSTLASFKSVIFNYFKSALAVSYDCEDPRSFKSISGKI